MKLFESWLEAISCHVLSLYIGDNFHWFVRFVQNNPLIVFPKVTKLQIELRYFQLDNDNGGCITKLFPNLRDLSLQFGIGLIEVVLHAIRNVYILRNLECIELNCNMYYISSDDLEKNAIYRILSKIQF
jgi:hypothetical protein